MIYEEHLPFITSNLIIKCNKITIKNNCLLTYSDDEYDSDGVDIEYDESRDDDECSVWNPTTDESDDYDVDYGEDGED